MKIITLPDGRRVAAPHILTYAQQDSRLVLTLSGGVRIETEGLSAEELDSLLAEPASEEDAAATLRAVGELLEKQDLPGALSSFIRRFEAALQRLVSTFPTSIRMRM